VSTLGRDRVLEALHLRREHIVESHERHFARNTTTARTATSRFADPVEVDADDTKTTAAALPLSNRGATKMYW
jgi:hypothetical protein